MGKRQRILRKLSTNTHSHGWHLGDIVVGDTGVFLRGCGEHKCLI